jgi:hypothetical protein
LGSELKTRGQHRKKGHSHRFFSFWSYFVEKKILRCLAWHSLFFMKTKSEPSAAAQSPFFEKMNFALSLLVAGLFFSLNLLWTYSYFCRIV